MGLDGRWNTIHSGKKLLIPLNVMLFRPMKETTYWLNKRISGKQWVRSKTENDGRSRRDWSLWSPLPLNIRYSNWWMEHIVTMANANGYSSICSYCSNSSFDTVAFFPFCSSQSPGRTQCSCKSTGCKEADGDRPVPPQSWCSWLPHPLLCFALCC